jgi:hypothetical protein
VSTEDDLAVSFPAACESNADDRSVDSHSDRHEFPAREYEGAARSAIKKLPNGASLAWFWSFGLCTAMIFCLSILAGEYIQKRANDLNETPLVQIPMARFATARQGVSAAGENSARVLPIAALPAVLLPKTLSPAARQWSVQVSAAPAKDIADSLAQQLKTNGYDGYVLQAEVKGQTYFRVRVGHFASQEEAESLRQLLAGEEDYRTAYLAFD